MNNKQLSILSLSRRAGKLVLGFDKAKEAILKGQVPCVFVTQDLSPKTQKEVEFLCGSRGVPVVPLAVEMDQVKAQVGKRSGVLLILDPDSISQETRDALVAVLGEEALEPATQEAIQAQVDQISAMMETWKNRDVAGFEKIYNKEAILESDDELNSKLFLDRDPGMIQYAADYLSQEGSHTGLMVVGAGHMVGDTGIVQGLIDQGYTVEVVPNP